MTISAQRTPPKRARSTNQKLERRRTILQAADRHLREAGFEAFSMSALAKTAGLGKGTLYLYFHTREEVFLALCDEKVSRWAAALRESMLSGMSDDAFACLFFETATTDPTLIPLLLRLDIVIEHNVSLGALIDSKRALRNVLAQLSGEVAQALGFTTEQGFEVIASLAPLLLGASQTDQAPSLEDEDLPEDVREFVNAFSSEGIFLRNARRILAGIRAGE